MKKHYPCSIIFIICFCLILTAHGQQGAKTPAPEKAADLLNRGNADSALIMADSELQAAISRKDVKGQIMAMRTKGKALFRLKKSKEAVDLFFDALRLCRDPEDKNETALLYSDIGYTYFTQGHFREAKAYYQKELPIRRALSGNDSLGSQLINLAVMHQDLKEFDSAYIVLNQVGDILSRVSDPHLAGYYYLNRGSFMELTGKLDSGAYYYKKAYDTWNKIGNESEIFKATFNLGYIEEERKNYRVALSYYHLSMEAAKQFGSQREIAHVYGTMAEAYAAINDYKNGYDYLYKYANLSDSLSRDEYNNYVVKLDKQFQTEKNRETIREQQLQLNTANLEVQKQQNKALVIIIILIGVVLVAVMLFGYLNFQSRVQKQVEAAKGKFFANVVHEIRTPLSMIHGPVKVLQAKVTDATLLHQLDIADRNVNRLNDLINQMLDISKIDAAKYVLTESVGSLSGFLDEIAGHYQHVAHEKNLSFSKQVDVTDGNLVFDKDALEKVIGNLLGNAIKYTPGGGAIGLDVFAIPGPAYVNCTFNIWDTGPGISAADRANIFSRFYRGKEQQEAGIKGIGIGLSLVNDLVSLMKGAINVDSEPGKGAVFTVTIPFKQAKQATVDSESANTAEHIILLVEDDPDILDFNRILLSEKGFHVITANNGDEAAVILKEQLPDLVVTDLMMPGKDGITLLKEIRGSELTNHIPVIILSAKASGQAKLEGVTEGAQAYLSKPFQPEELIGLVKNQLQVIQKYKTNYQQQTTIKGQSIEQRFSGSDPFTQKCFSLISEHLNDAQLSVEKLAELMFVNRSHFQRKIKTLTGYSPSELIRIIRLEKAREMLQKREGNITETAYSTGFTSQSYFTKCYSEHFGYPPSQELSNI